jgi:hypothetical protein
VVDEKLCSIHNKQINAAIKAINDFCRAGREGYERLALVIVSDGATANISSEVSTGNVNYVNQDNSALKWLMEGPSATGTSVAVITAAAGTTYAASFTSEDILQLIDVDTVKIATDGSATTRPARTVSKEFRL